MAIKTPASIIGRDAEIGVLRAALDSDRAELIAVYGRRRVGKTHLIRELFEAEAELHFVATGEKDASLAVQLHHFAQSIVQSFGGTQPTFTSWREAFEALSDAVDGCRAKRIALFIDELPWMATRRSGLLQALDYYWNTRLSRVSRVSLVLCGSAASWMLDKLIHAKGGLYNRITGRLHLQPFDLKSTKALLASKNIRLKPNQVLELYMALGGIPHHLLQIAPGKSATQNIGAICFDRNGILSDEYDRLFQSLFDDPESHDALVRAIAKRRSGISVKALRATPGLPTGGRLTARLRELEAVGFIGQFIPYGKRIRDSSYRITDEFLWFYLSWMDKQPRPRADDDGAAYWLSKATTPTYRSWTGYAFEATCLKHAAQIRRALGIEGITLETGTWRFVPAKGSTEAGAQIDLLFDRTDNVIQLCELKYANTEFVVTKAYARELKQKMEVFERGTGTKKDVFLALVTTHGLKANAWSEDLITNVATVDDLFT